MADNAAFLLGALDQFAGNPNLARLRARPPSIRPMTRVTRLREAAEADYLAEQSRLEDELSTCVAEQLELVRDAACGFVAEPAH